MIQRALVSWIAIFAVLLPTTARAQPSDERPRDPSEVSDEAEPSDEADADEALRERARALYRTARTLDEEGRTREAVPLAEEAYRIYPTAGSRYAIGVLYERLGERETAIVHYRTALGEPRRGDARLYEGIAQALERLGAEDTTPLDPPTTPVVEEQVDEEERDPPRDDEPEPIAPPPRRVLSGLRLSASVLADVLHIDRAWAGNVSAGYRFDFGLFGEVGFHFPHPTVELSFGIEIGDFLVKPIVAAFVAVSPLRTFDDDPDVAVVLGPRLGIAVAPFGDEQLTFALDGALAIDVTRTDEGFIFAVPLSLALRWIPDL